MRYQRLHGGLAAQRAAVVQKWHRNQVVTEDKTLSAHERQHACHLPLVVTGCEVQALVSENFLDDRFPTPAVEVGPFGAGVHARIPLGPRPVKGFHARRRRAGSSIVYGEVVGGHGPGEVQPLCPAGGRDKRPWADTWRPLAPLVLAAICRGDATV